MLSLRDKLRSAAGTAAPRKAPAAVAADCYLRQERIPISRFDLPPVLSGETLTLMQGTPFADCAREDVLFLDTETTGLSHGAGTVAFLVGVGFFEEDAFVVRQYLMRDYDEEPFVLSHVAEHLRRSRLICTFNGASFDLPLLESRMVMNRIRAHITDMPHLDLLHAARRVYKLRLGRCSLTALEEAVLSKARQDDLPGAQVPERYFTYLKTGEFALLEDVLRHNFDDVRSLAELTAVICSAYRRPEALRYEQDILSVGKTFLRGGRTQQARACFKILGHSTLSPQAHLYLSSSYKRGREWNEAAALWKDMIARGEGGVWPYIELAKYYEHVRRDYGRAQRCAAAALQYALNTAPLGGEDEQLAAAIFKRIDRLKRKQKAQQGGNQP